MGAVTSSENDLYKTLASGPTCFKSYITLSTGLRFIQWFPKYYNDSAGQLIIRWIRVIGQGPISRKSR